MVSAVTERLKGKPKEPEFQFGLTGFKELALDDFHDPATCHLCKIYGHIVVDKPRMMFKLEGI